MTTPIVRFIEARCADEPVAAIQRQALRATAGLFPDEDLDAVVRRVAAYRRILAEELANRVSWDGEMCACYEDEVLAGHCDRWTPEKSRTLHALASVWSTHPDYRPKWAEPKD